MWPDEGRSGGPRRAAGPDRRPGVLAGVDALFGAADAETVTCIACGRELARERAREYDKEGDRWDRAGKHFEHLCKPCHGDLSHQPRDELEALLVEIDAGDCDREQFLQWYCHLVEERYGPLEEE